MSRLASRRRPETRDRSRRRLALESLEGRMVLSTASIMGPVLPAAQVAQNNATPSTTPATQQGTAFNVAWKSTWDPINKTYDIFVQDSPGSNSIALFPSSQGLEFVGTSGKFGVVQGPQYAQGTSVQVYVYSDQMGLDGGDSKIQTNVGVPTLDVPRITTTQVQTLSTNASGANTINVTYSFNCVSNTGTFQIADAVDNMHTGDSLSYVPVA
jgi:hypothetical protein